MFEDSVFASRRQQRSGRKGWAVVGALAVQGAVVAGVLIAPMLRPEALTVKSTAPVVDLTVLRKVVQPKVEEVRPRTMMAAAPGISSPSATAAPVSLLERAGGTVSSADYAAEGPALALGGLGMRSGSGLPSAALANVGGSGTVVRPAPGKVRISSGVSSGMLLAPMRVVYPVIAKAAKVEGTVVVTATIDTTGRIVGLQVTSGPAMLRGAAIAAVKEARYKPFFLNGELTEVETTILVNFRLGG